MSGGPVVRSPGMPALLAVTFTGFSGYAAMIAVAPLWAVRGGSDEVGAGLERVAEVGGHRAADEPARHQVALVGQPGVRGEISVLAEQPEQLRQRPRRLHPLVAELLPDRRADLVDPVDLGGGARVVVHEAGGQRGPLAVDEQHGSRGGVDGDPAHRGRVDVAQRLPAGRGDGPPPVVGILLVPRPVAPAVQRP